MDHPSEKLMELLQCYFDVHYVYIGVKDKHKSEYNFDKSDKNLIEEVKVAFLNHSHFLSPSFGINLGWNAHYFYAPN